MKKSYINKIILVVSGRPTGRIRNGVIYDNDEKYELTATLKTSTHYSVFGLH